jgi:hypothetical protein
MFFWGETDDEDRELKKKKKKTGWRKWRWVIYGPSTLRVRRDVLFCFRFFGGGFFPLPLCVLFNGVCVAYSRACLCVSALVIYCAHKPIVLFVLFFGVFFFDWRAIYIFLVLYDAQFDQHFARFNLIYFVCVFFLCLFCGRRRRRWNDKLSLTWNLIFINEF